MPNQREIAEALGVNQSTVSLALRGSKRVAPAMRKKICKAAKQMGYTPNPAINAVMSRIRAGKKIKDQGVIAVLIEARSLEEWHEIETYRTFHEGLMQRAFELGYRMENFFLQAPNMDPSKIDGILTARGITGIIFAPPYHSNRKLNLTWERYSAIGVGFGWEDQELNRVVYNSLHSFKTAFMELRKMGYQRIGVAIHKNFVTGSRHGIKWYTAYLDCQNELPVQNRIPVFAADTPNPGEPLPDALEKKLIRDFHQWVSKCKPDALLTIIGTEISWLKEMGLEVPRDIGVACLAVPKDSLFAGIEEKSEVIGASAIEWVAGKIAQNDLGLPVHKKTMMIEGVWVRGQTVQTKKTLESPPGSRSESMPTKRLHPKG